MPGPAGQELQQQEPESAMHIPFTGERYALVGEQAGGQADPAHQMRITSYGDRIKAVAMDQLPEGLIDLQGVMAFRRGDIALLGFPAKHLPLRVDMGGWNCLCVFKQAMQVQPDNPGTESFF